MSKLSVEYNSQRDNFEFGGRFRAWSQCFSTSAWMLICYWLRQRCTDTGLRSYVEAVELKVGHGSIARRVTRYARWITGYTSLWWLVQQAGIAEYLSGLGGKVVFRESDGTWDEVSEALTTGPVIIGTTGLPGLRGGHIVLIIGETVDSWIVHDPYGDARTAYRDTNGEAVRYQKAWFAPYCEKVVGKSGKIRIMYYNV